MLPLSANPDFKDLGELKSPNPYYDLNGDKLSEHIEIYKGIGSCSQFLYVYGEKCNEKIRDIYSYSFLC